MIRFEKNSQNIVTVTLTELSTLADPIYLFMFRNQQGNQKYYFIAADTSLYKERYNRFLVTEIENPDTLNGQVELGLKGLYDYEIYQTSLQSLSGLTNANEAIEFITRTVEKGIVEVVMDAPDLDSYSPESNTNIVYQRTNEWR